MGASQQSFIDQMKNRITLRFPPRRIVSLVPSQTELLADLGLNKEVVGITKYCIHPDSWRNLKHIVGGTKNFQFDAIDQLEPDLIIGNKEENFKEGIEHLKSKYPVWMSDITTLEDALKMIQSVGKITDREKQAQTIVHEIVEKFSVVRKFSAASVLYLIWRKPWMAAGRDTFISTLLTKIGLENAVSTRRYPQLTTAQMQELNPDYIFLSSEPYPFREKHIAELREVCPSAKIILVDGEMFSWYGSRLKKAPDYFNSINLD